MLRHRPGLAREASRASRWAIVPLAIAQLIIALDIYIVFVALPDIGRGLGFSDQSLQWVVSAYVLAFGGFLLFGGRASDLFGRRRVFLLALGIYATSSTVGGLANTQAMMIAARAAQGFGGALLFPATLSLITTSFREGRERNRALAIWGGAGASGLTLGSLLGGLLTGGFGWSAVFFVNVPLAAAVALVALAVVPGDRPRQRAHGGRNFDLAGALSITSAVSLLVFVLVQGPAVGFGSAAIVVAAALSLVLFAGFVVIERRTPDPLMPLRLFRGTSLPVAVAITFVFMGTFGTLPYFLTLLFQDVHGFSSIQTGLAFLVGSVAIFAGTQFGERAVTKGSARTGLLLGFGVGAIGTAILASSISAGGSYAALVPGLVLMGVGQGTAWTAMWVAAAAGVDGNDQGVAAGIAGTTQNIGYAVGLAILVAIANAGLHGASAAQQRIALAGGVESATYVIAAALLLGVLLALALPRPGRNSARVSGRRAPAAAPDPTPGRSGYLVDHQPRQEMA